MPGGKKMKKIFAILFCLILMLSVFAVAQEESSDEGSDESNEETGEGEEEDTGESEEETDDEEETDEDDDDDLEDEAADYEEEKTGDEIIDDIEDEEETDDEIEEELELDEEEQEEIDEAESTIGLRQYVLNRQLKARIHVAVVHGGIIIKHLGNSSDTSELQEILDELEEIGEAKDPKTMTKDEFGDIVEDVKELVQNFKEEAWELVPEDERPALRKRIQKFQAKQDKKIESILKKAWKARELYNRKQLRNALRKVKEDAKQLRKDGKKLLEAATRLKALHKLKQNYQNGILNATEIKTKWKDGTRLYGLARAASVVKNERGLLAIGVARINKAIRAAKAAGEDTTELETKLEEIKEKVKEFVAGKLTSEEVEAKATVIRSRLFNLEKNTRIANRIKTVAAVRRELSDARAISNQAIRNQEELREAIATQNQVLRDRLRSQLTGEGENTDTAAGDAP